MIIYEDSYINGKLVKEMTDAEKQEFIDRQLRLEQCKRVIIEGYNDGTK
jgi:hypothetical protein